MRSLIVCGLRRSGTSILYEALSRDSRLRGLYEPLGVVRDEPVRGGSSVITGDVMAEVRRVRAGFLAQHPEIDPAIVNHGAPRDANVEIDPALPAAVRAYLESVHAPPGPRLTKYVRATERIDVLADLEPDGVLVWTTRDPREVVRSYLHGRERRWQRFYTDADAVFSTRSNRDPWAVRRLSEALLQRAGSSAADPTDAERIVMVWAWTLGRLEQDGPRRFGERALRIRHEDFGADPERWLSSIYELAGASPHAGPLTFARDELVPPPRWEIADDPRWGDLFARAGAAELVDRLGYTN